MSRMQSRRVGQVRALLLAGALACAPGCSKSSGEHAQSAPAAHSAGSSAGSGGSGDPADEDASAEVNGSASDAGAGKPASSGSGARDASVASRDAGGSSSDAGAVSASPDAGSGAPNPPFKPGPVAFPLKLSANGRYLVDQNNQPFLINQASSWGLIQSLSTADATDYLDGLAKRGFNTVMVSIISYDTRFAGDPPNWQGVTPFNTQWDFSTYNEKYFAHADEIIRLAEQRGMLVTLVPCYLGYATEPNQGWADELLSNNNNVAKSQAYGQFLGKRYKGFNNIIWIAGGDNTPPAGSELEKRHKAIVDAIKQASPNQLWTGHWDSVSRPNGALSTDYPALASAMDLNGYYAFNYDGTQTRDVEAYNRSPVKMFFHLDMSYETEPGGTPENIRRKAYTAMLTGAAGSSFCAGPKWYLFFEWRANLDTTGSKETVLWYKLFSARKWYELVPDLNHTVVTGGYGKIESNDYVAAARTSSGGTVIAYLPTSRTISVDMHSVSGNLANGWWYDPTSGRAMAIGTIPTTGTKMFTPPASGSWVLVLDDMSLALPAPGMM